MTTTRTLEGIKLTRKIAERDGWHDYGGQAFADVDWLIERLDALGEVIAETQGAENALLEEYHVWRRTWENNPTMEAMKYGIVALRRIRQAHTSPTPTIVGGPT